MKKRSLNWLVGQNIFITSVAAIGLAALVPSVNGASLVTNGDFEQLAKPGFAAEFGSRYPAQQVTGWTTSGYNFVFTSGSADTKGARGEYGGVRLWGPGSGSNNGLPASSPAGGNYLALDGAYVVGPVSQTLTGLTPGTVTTVSFYWGGAQQQGYTGKTTEQLKVSLGSQSDLTPVLTNASHGFTGWRKTTFSFTPTSSSALLSFLSIGTPGGVPPFALLDGVTASDTPEPATWGLLVASFAGIGAFAMLRRKTARNKA